MNAVKEYEKALWELEHNIINSGEFDDRIAPLIDVEPKQKWIPVSERLPEYDFTDVLVQIGYGDDALFETAYIVRGNWVFYSGRIDGYGTSITAWMPLPEPYKEVKEHDGREGRS